MDILMIQSKSKSNSRLISSIARKLGEQVEILPQNNKYRERDCLAVESAWAKDWLTPEEDEAWKDL